MDNFKVDTSDEKWAKFDRWDRKCNQRVHHSKDEQEYIVMFAGMGLFLIVMFGFAFIADCFFKATS